MCIFCKIASKEVPKKLVYEDDEVVAFDDIHPIAPVHILVIPKRHIPSVNDLADGDLELAGRIVLVAKKIAEELQISKNGYKLLFRVGEWGGQEITHVHLHLIGGAKLMEDIRPEEE